MAVATHYSILQLNLHYPDLAYLDFLIRVFGLASLVPVFHEYWCSSRSFSQQNFLASNYVMKAFVNWIGPPFKTQIWRNFVLISQFWLARICSVSEWNFTHHELNQYVLKITQASYQNKCIASTKCKAIHSFHKRQTVN